MIARAIVLGSCAVVALGIGAAQAGPCTAQIDSLSKTLASSDAGSGPTSGAGSTASTATAPAGQHAPTSAMSQQTQGVATSPEDVRRQTAGQPTASQQGTTGASTEHPPTAVMNQATQNQAAPQGGHPPTAVMSEATKGQTPPPAAKADKTQASAALERAREFDRQGKETDCMNAIGEARRLSGS